MKSYIWLLLGGGVAAALAYFASGIDKIAIRIIGVEIEGVSLNKTKVLVELGILNPTKAALTIKSIKGTINAGTRQLGTINTQNLNAAIQANQETIIRVDILLTNASVLYTLFLGLAKQNKSLAVTINYQISTNLGTISGSKDSTVDVSSIQDLLPNAGHTVANSNLGPQGPGRASKVREKL